jgi:hypothetical protein
MAKPKIDKELMSVLMRISYKGFPVMIRSVGDDIFLWDIFANGEFYGSYVIMGPRKGQTKLSAKDRDEVVKICYAGAAATIDHILGIEPDYTMKAAVKRFTDAIKN